MLGGALSGDGIEATLLGDIRCDFHEEPLLCGFPTLERYLYLRQNQPDLVVVAARPGVGKTGFVCQVGLNVAQHSNVLMFSLEMTKEQLKKRMIAVESGHAISQLKYLKRQEIDAILVRMNAFKIAIDDQNAINIDTLIAKARQYSEKKRLSLVIVDYLQIVTIRSMRTKTEEVQMIAERLKTLAKELHCPVLAVAQMNRNMESRASINAAARPLMSDLADSAGIEKWADTIIFLNRPGIYDKTRQDDEADVFVAKHRNGQSRDFKMTYIGEMTKFIDHGGAA